MIIKHLELPPIGTNCYILGNETTKECIVVDPGGGASTVIRTMAKEGLTMKAILLTHGHYDHTGAVLDLRHTVEGLPVYLHPADIAQLGDQLMPDIGETIPYGEGDSLDVGGMHFDVIHTPGHTSGCICLIMEKERVLVAGDTLFQGSMGRTDLPSGDYGEMMASLKRLYELEGDYHVLPGHMGQTTLQRERVTNYYMKEAIQN